MVKEKDFFKAHVDGDFYEHMNKMKVDRVFGTDVELLGFATLLQTRIYTWTNYGKDRYSWNVFNPIAKVVHLSLAKSDRCIYLSNCNLHYQPVLNVKECVSIL